MPRYQEGSIRQIKRAEGMTWVLRYYATRADGKRVEHTVAIGLVKDIGPKKADASREADRQKLRETINHTTALPGKTEDVWSALSALHRERAEDRPDEFGTPQGVSHRRDLRATPRQAHHSPLGSIWRHWQSSRRRSRNGSSN